MIDKVKLALRVTTTAFDSELLDLIQAGISDLNLDGTVFMYSRTVSTSGATTDYLISDPLVAQAVTTYCKCHFGDPDNYDRFKAAYDEQKAQLRAVEAYSVEQ